MELDSFVEVSFKEGLAEGVNSFVKSIEFIEGSIVKLGEFFD